MTLQVGDRVRVLYDDWSRSYRGYRGTVEALDPDATYRVRMDWCGLTDARGQPQITCERFQSHEITQWT